MFVVNDDMSIYITRGDVAVFDVVAEDKGVKYSFQPGDVVRIKVTEKKNCDNVVLQKDFPVLEAADKVEIVLEEKDTKIGGIISKPVDYWYEIELNPHTNPQTIIGYDDDGAKVFKLFPEGKTLSTDITEEDIPVVDDDLSLASDRPVQNRVIARNFAELSGQFKAVKESTADSVRFSAQILTEEHKSQVRKNIDAVSQRELEAERTRISNLASISEGGLTTADAELMDIRVGYDGTTYESAGDAVRAQVLALHDKIMEGIPSGGGGGSSMLIVTTEQSDPEMWVASHSAQQIYTHVQAGGLAVLLHQGLYYTLSTVSVGTAVFSWYDASQEYLMNYILYNDRELYCEVTDLPSGGGSADGAVLYTEQTLTEEQKAQARENIGAASADDVSPVAPRAQMRQIRLYDTAGKEVFFEDVYARANGEIAYPAGRCVFIYGLEAHKPSSTKQRVFKSVDGETWTEHASLTIDAANGVWFTNLFVDERQNVLILLKTTDGFAQQNNYVSTFIYNGTDWWNAKNLELGKKRWLGNNNSIDACTDKGWTQRAIIFGEYGTTTDGTTYALWKSTDGGVNWKKVLELNGDSGGSSLNGEIRHWHTVVADPWTAHWWASSGDGDSQCKIYRSKDMGETWELMFSGSQRERTCGFVFEQDCIYYGMDATCNWDKNFTKIVKIDKGKLDTDRANCREDVAVVDSAFAVYGLTRTYYPDGFIVWSQQEPAASYTPGRYILQFYDYATKKMYPIAYFNTSNIANSNYIGFYAGSREQHNPSGCIYAMPTRSLQSEKYGDSYVSTHIKINLTM